MNYLKQTAVLCGMLALPYGCASMTSGETPPIAPEAQAGSERVNANSGGNVNDEDKTQVSYDEKLKNACGLPPLDAYFEFDSAKLKDANGKMDLLAACLTAGALKDRDVRIVGYTDPRGSDKYNKKLGKSRAESVASALENGGVKKNKIILLSEGKEYSVGKNEKGFAFDRRVEIHLAD